MYFLKKLTDFNDSGPFRLKNLKENEKKKILGYFHDFPNDNRQLLKSPNYRFIQNNIEKLKSLNQQVNFIDFILNDIDGKSIALSDVLQKNNITVLDFWWSGCKPCREFNQETSTMYDSLKKNGIEIVGINVDESKERWLKASANDSINWINLYAGAVSDIKVKYNVVEYPTKLVFDKDQKLIDFKFKKASELLVLTKD